MDISIHTLIGIIGMAITLDYNEYHIIIIPVLFSDTLSHLLRAIVGGCCIVVTLFGIRRYKRKRVGEDSKSIEGDR